MKYNGNVIKTLVITSLLVLTSCASLGEKTVVTKTQRVIVPILYCPSAGEIKRPELPLKNIPPQDKNNPGKIAQYYKASLIILIGYIEELENRLKVYNQTNKAYSDLKKVLLEELKRIEQQTKEKTNDEQ